MILQNLSSQSGQQSNQDDQPLQILPSVLTSKQRKSESSQSRHLPPQKKTNMAYGDNDYANQTYAVKQIGRRANSIIATQDRKLPQMEPLGNLAAQGFTVNPKYIRAVKRTFVNSKALKPIRDSRNSARSNRSGSASTSRAQTQNAHRRGEEADLDSRTLDNSSNINQDIGHVGGQPESPFALQDETISKKMQNLKIYNEQTFDGSDRFANEDLQKNLNLELDKIDGDTQYIETVKNLVQDTQEAIYKSKTPIFVKQDQTVVRIELPQKPSTNFMNQRMENRKKISQDEEHIFKKLQNHILFVQQREMLLREEFNLNQQLQEQERMLTQLNYSQYPKGKRYIQPRAHHSQMGVPSREFDKGELEEELNFTPPSEWHQQQFGQIDNQGYKGIAQTQLRNILPTSWANIMRQKQENKKKIIDEYKMPDVQPGSNGNKEKFLGPFRNRTSRGRDGQGEEIENQLAIGNNQVVKIVDNAIRISARRNSDMAYHATAANGKYKSGLQFGFPKHQGDPVFTNENLCGVSHLTTRTVKKSIETDGINGSQELEHQQQQPASLNTMQDPTTIEPLSLYETYEQQNQKQRNALKEFSPFLTKNCSSTINPYKRKVVWNKQYYRDKLDTSHWYEKPADKAKGAPNNVRSAKKASKTNKEMQMMQVGGNDIGEEYNEVDSHADSVRDLPVIQEQKDSARLHSQHLLLPSRHEIQIDRKLGINDQNIQKIRDLHSQRTQSHSQSGENVNKDDWSQPPSQPSHRDSQATHQASSALNQFTHRSYLTQQNFHKAQPSQQSRNAGDSYRSATPNQQMLMAWPSNKQSRHVEASEYQETPRERPAGPSMSNTSRPSTEAKDHGFHSNLHETAQQQIQIPAPMQNSPRLVDYMNANQSFIFQNQAIPSPHDYSNAMRAQKFMQWQIRQSTNFTKVKAKVANQIDRQMENSLEKKRIIKIRKKPEIAALFTAMVDTVIKTREKIKKETEDPSHFLDPKSGIKEPGEYKKKLGDDLRHPKARTITKEQHEDILVKIKELDIAIKERKIREANSKKKTPMPEKFNLFQTIHMPKAEDVLMAAVGDLLNLALEEGSQVKANDEDAEDEQDGRGDLVHDLVVRGKIEDVKKRFDQMVNGEAKQIVKEMTQLDTGMLNGLEKEVVIVLGILLREVKVNDVKENHLDKFRVTPRSPAMAPYIRSIHKQPNAKEKFRSKKQAEVHRKRNVCKRFRVDFVYAAYMTQLKEILEEAMRMKPKQTKEEPLQKCPIQNVGKVQNKAVYTTKVCLGDMIVNMKQGLYENETLKSLHAKTAIPNDQFWNDFYMNKGTTVAKTDFNLNELLLPQISKMEHLKDVRNDDQDDQLKYIKFDGQIDARIDQQSSQAFVMPMLYVDDDCLSFTQIPFTENQLQNLQTFLRSAVVRKQIGENGVKTVIIDSCAGMTDCMLADLIDTLVEMYGDGITRFMIENQEFGKLSSAALLPLLPRLYMIKLSNLKIVEDPKAPNEESPLTQALLSFKADETKMQRSTLLYLHLSKMNLSKALPHLLAILESQIQSLISIDLSWTNLDAKCLAEFLGGYVETVDALRIVSPLRCLALAYNVVGKGAESRQLVGKLQTFFKSQYYSKYLMHLNLSGLYFSGAQIHSMCETLSGGGVPDTAEAKGNPAVPNLCALHLSDMGITRDKEYQEEILHMFQIFEEENADLFGAVQALQSKSNRGAKSRHIDYEGVVAKALKDKETAPGADPSPLMMERQKAKNDYIKHLKYQNVKKQKNTVRQLVGGGMPRNEKGRSELDDFIITRKLNRPELIFNQDYRKDQNQRTRWFEKDSVQHWARSERIGECYCCNKQKYTIIFYDRNNKDASLTEIKDLKFKHQLKLDYDSITDRMKAGDSTASPQAPVICGTVVRDGYEYERGCHPPDQLRMCNDQFRRKLRMLRADLFALLSISQSSEFFKKSKDAQIVKSSIMKFLQTEQDDRIAASDILKPSKGWNVLMNQKCFHNQIVDTMTLNAPKCLGQPEHEEPSKDAFAYAAYLEPGYHYWVIYDPEEHRAFVQEAFVEPSRFEHFPELPAKVNSLILPQKAFNCFAKWEYFDIKRQKQAFMCDTEPMPEKKSKFRNRNSRKRDNFEAERFITNKDDVAKCERILLENFLTIEVNYISNQATSSKYPEVDYESFKNSILSVQHAAAKNGTKLPCKLRKDAIDAAWEGGTDNDKDRGQAQALCRGEYMEALLNLACAWKKLYFKDKNKITQEKAQVSDCLQEFLGCYLRPVFQRMQYYEIRDNLHKNKLANKLLFQNRINLKRLYNECLINGEFTLQSVAKLFEFQLPVPEYLDEEAPTKKVAPAGFEEGPDHPWYPFSMKILTWIFVASKQCVVDEVRAQRFAVHRSLKHVEFQEFLGRVSIQYHRRVNKLRRQSVAEFSEQATSPKAAGVSQGTGFPMEDPAKEADAEDEDEDDGYEEDEDRDSGGEEEDQPKPKVEQQLFQFLDKLFDRKYTVSAEFMSKHEIDDADANPFPEVALWTKEQNPLQSYLEH